ncbi:cupredoxin domain-containing protein [Eleftheria terrae]|uniref:cupredoxin domain-containing protein n=1 Tax=Eleftheria terrae TaxID=1597781 RepID=UPI00263A802A|nr:cupredoxin family protein [Eleftheria terrae]WKB54008.1 cupredoxin family protein [Eleftheria terrae]
MKSHLFLITAALCLGLSQPMRAHEPSAHRQRPPAPAEQTAWGIAGDPKAVHRRVEIDMGDDMRFSPDRLEVRQGETVELVIHNRGRAQHELVLGTREALQAHAALMARHPGMEHDEPHIAHVAPGETGRLVWTFNRAGQVEFACLVAGHYEAGMAGRVHVRP